VSSERHELISDIFLKACDLDSQERKDFLDEACEGDDELRAEIESLLSYDEIAAQALESGAGGARLAAALGERAGLSATKTGQVFGEYPEIPGYRVLRLIGEGGMGQVFLAEDTSLGRQVAIKTMLEQHAVETRATERFIREARAMATVEHPHIVRVYSFGQIANRHYLVMEFVEGQSLAARIKRIGKLGVEESLRILGQSVEALEAAWAHGIVHRDVKPANVLLDVHDQVRVADFGLAKATMLEGDASLTHAGHLLGTPQYLSPEQARGEKKVDFRTDIYSLGIVLYEMLAGEPPFRGETPLSVVDQHLHTPIPSVRSSRPEVSGEVEQLCEWMTRKQPADRPGSYAELRATIDALLGEATTIPTGPPSLPSFLIERDEAKATPFAGVFVGRELELGRLNGLLDQTLKGRGQVVFVTGEAGSGKTALISECDRRAQEKHETLIVARGNCDAQAGSGDPYRPFREVLSLLTGEVESKRASGAMSRDHARRLWSLLPLTCQALVDEAPDLVGTFVPGKPLVSRAASFTPSPAGWRVQLEELVQRGTITPRDASLQQSYLFEQYARMLQALSRQHPLILELEDFQWADGGSCSLLFHLARQIAGSRILVVCTYRPGVVALEHEGQPHPLKSIVSELKRQFGEIEVPVGEEETREFTDALLDCEPNRLELGFRDALYHHTRGHPLFTVELLRSMREQNMLEQNEDGEWVDGSALDWSLLPARVEGAISERVGRLSDNLRRLLSLASVQGEEFTAEVLSRVQGASSRQTVDVLSRELDKRHGLIKLQGIQRKEGQRISTYRFRHILFQFYLYGELDEAERSYLHEEVGDALETIYGDQVEEVAFRLARHFDEAGVTPKTVHYLRLAGDRAVRMSANEEAIADYNKALGLLDRLPPGAETDRKELALQLALGPPLMDTAGPGSADLNRAYTRAWQLCERVGEAPQRFQTLFILVHHHANVGDLQRTLELAEQLVQVAESTEESAFVIPASWARGFALHYHGRFHASREDHERVIALYDPEQHSSLAYVFGMDPAVSALSYAGVSSWCLGFPDQALDYARRASDLARELDHPSTLAHALTQNAVLAIFCRDADVLRERVEELERLTTEKGVLLFRAWAVIFHGCVLAQQGRLADGAARIRDGLDAAEATGSRLSHPAALGQLAAACRDAGEVEEGLRHLANAISTVRQTGEHQYEAELHRLHGELQLANGASADAEADFRHAIDIARKQKARSWELRATMSLARYLRASGRSDEARRSLSDAYDWFSEGFDSPDLEEARSLLRELSPERSTSRT